jgi:hypothetical protein
LHALRVWIVKPEWVFDSNLTAISCDFDRDASLQPQLFAYVSRNHDPSPLADDDIFRCHCLTTASNYLSLVAIHPSESIVGKLFKAALDTVRAIPCGFTLSTEHQIEKSEPFVIKAF